jgi:hypothetical protein
MLQKIREQLEKKWVDIFSILSILLFVGVVFPPNMIYPYLRPMTLEYILILSIFFSIFSIILCSVGIVLGIWNKWRILIFILLLMTLFVEYAVTKPYDMVDTYIIPFEAKS